MVDFFFNSLFVKGIFCNLVKGSILNISQWKFDIIEGAITLILTHCKTHFNFQQKLGNLFSSSTLHSLNRYALLCSVIVSKQGGSLFCNCRMLQFFRKNVLSMIVHSITFQVQDPVSITRMGQLAGRLTSPIVVCCCCLRYYLLPCQVVQLFETSSDGYVNVPWTKLQQRSISLAYIGRLVQHVNGHIFY